MCGYERKEFLGGPFFISIKIFPHAVYWVEERGGDEEIKMLEEGYGENDTRMI